MYKTIPLTNLGLKSPIVDIDSASLGPEIFTKGHNVRSIDDKFVSSNGSSLLYDPVGNFYAGLLDVVNSGSNLYYVVLGRALCKVYNGSAWYDITSTSLSTTPMLTDQELRWTSTKLGIIPVYNNPNHWPVYWSPQSTSQVLQLLKFNATNTWKDKGYTCKVMRAHKGFLFALNLTEGGVNYPYAYRWSHPADINGLPPSWDDADLSYIASREQIAGNGGEIVDGATIRDAFCIYSKNAITMLDYLGDSEFVFSARNLSEDFGLVCVNALASIKGVNYFLTDGDILANDGNSLQSILTAKQRRSFASKLSATNYANSFAIVVPNMSEVWFFIVEESYSYPSVIYIYNVLTGVLTTRDCSGIASAAYGLKVSIDDSIDGGTSGTIDSDTAIFDINNFSPFSSQVLGVGNSNSAVYTLDATTDSYNSILERTNFAPDGLTTATTIVAWYPQIACSGSVNFQAGSQQYKDGPISWKPAVTFNPNTQRRIALRTTGKLHCWRISSIGNSSFKMSGLTLEYTEAGAR